MASEAHNDSNPSSFFDQKLLECSEDPAAALAEVVARKLQCDEVHVNLTTEPHKEFSAIFTLFRTQATRNSREALFKLVDGSLSYNSKPITSPLMANDLSRARLPGDLAMVLSTLGVKSFGVFRIIRQQRVLGVIACFYKKGFHRWRSDELSALDTLGDILPDSARGLTSPILQGESQQSSVERYQRLASRGNIIILTTDKDFRIEDIFGNSELILGISPSHIKGDPSIWSKLVDTRDATRLLLRIKRLESDKAEVQEEIRIVHQATGQTRWILLRALAERDAQGNVIGWEGFGVDITERREAQEELRRQKLRLQALYEVSRALGELKDPAGVTLTGLRAVLRATRSECGYAVFCDRETHALEVVAAIGLSEQYLKKMRDVLVGPSILKEAIASHKRFLIPDLQQDPRAVVSLAKIEGLHATIVIPLTFENVAYGGLVLFKRTPDSYDEDDYDVATSAASQLTLAIRQAELLEMQRRQSASLSALYQVSRELAKYRHTVDFSQQIFPILQREFALKSGWIGLMNEQGTHVVGRAGFGTDLSKKSAEMQLAVTEDASAALRDVLSTKTTLIIEEPERAKYQALLSLFDSPSSLVVVPMVSIGHVMGFLILEPLSKQTFASSERLQLLVSMANEIAAAMMAGRFEQRMTHAVKMRSAGLLASGVAHNFNNILQAIIGQASLVQLRVKDEEAVSRASHAIQEAAMRGANLVNQLLGFATKKDIRKAPLKIAALLSESRPLYESLLGREIPLLLENHVLSTTAVQADSSQLQQVVTSILANAKDAVMNADSPEVLVSSHLVVIQPGEFSLDLAPGEYVRIDIKDNGVGMGMEEQARCFEPFFTTKNIDSKTGVGLYGSGLGLAAAYSIVKEHRGALTVQSREGSGTTLSIYLPSCSELTDDNNTFERIETVTNAGILLLGLDAGTQTFMNDALESFGYRVQTAHDVLQIKEMLQKHPNQWRVAVIDWNGIDSQRQAIIQELKAKFTHLNIVWLRRKSSQEDGNGDAVQLRAEGIYVIPKPVTGWDLELIIKEALRSNTAEIVKN